MTTKTLADGGDMSKCTHDTLYKSVERKMKCAMCHATVASPVVSVKTRNRHRNIKLTAYIAENFLECYGDMYPRNTHPNFHNLTSALRRGLEA